MFEIKNLKYKDILDIPELVIDKQVTCIVGPSGSGKQHFLKCLMYLTFLAAEI
ncbi:putative ABC transport system ATP-binding protein [Clostridium cadaveris]|uniref:Putative ABC transport system ATP-binding protein n=1 Tax=Clostridium cadaveris TaxID=1529 RepID=A0A1I2KC09_9CLOT|nr:putative ABC transport system ATP-binding protein [Clostridium cadaveris]